MDKVQHFEIPVDDTDRARKSYEASFGWATQDWPMPDGSTYIGLHTGPMDENNTWKEPGFINGGMFKRGGAFTVTAPTVAVVVEDIKATLDKVRQSGGTVVMDPQDVAGSGLYAYVKDTEGNTIGVWQDVKQ